ncbi:MAG: extracellular solute-binding protein [Anaerolineales bacterium]
MRPFPTEGLFPKLRLILAIAFILGACAVPPWLSPEVTEEPGAPTVQPATPTPDNSTSTAGATIITVWVPPGFDPGGGSPAASLLQTRFDEFAEQHPQLRIEARVKAESGTGGLLDSLVNAKVAAPLALPDLVLMPHTQLSNAAQIEILLPLTDLSEEEASDDWYGFATEMTEVDGVPFGLPFAGDALVLAYRPTALTQVPATWEALLEGGLQLGFAAADPSAVFTLTKLSNTNAASEGVGAGLLFSSQTLTSVFEFFANGEEAGVFPFWLSQYQTNEQSWQAFTEGRVPMVAAWTSRVFDTRNVDILGAPLPSNDGDPYTLVKGWAWAVSSPQTERQALAMELAEFLTTPEFIAQWTAAAGMLPTRHSSLAAWPPDDKQALSSQIADGAAALPDEAVLDVWGPALSEAVVALLKQEMTAEEAAQYVINAVSGQ